MSRKLATELLAGRQMDAAMTHCPKKMHCMGSILLGAVCLLMAAVETHAQIPWQAEASALLTQQATATPASWKIPDAGGRIVVRLANPFSAKRMRVLLELNTSAPLMISRTIRMEAAAAAPAGGQIQWLAMFPAKFAASQGQVSRMGPALRIEGRMQSVQIAVETGVPAEAISMIAIELGTTVAESPEIMLSALRFDRVNAMTTNAALGCDVRASAGDSTVEPGGFLTDGSVETRVHLHAGEDWWIDLKKTLTIDHLNVRFRSRAFGAVTQPPLKVALYDSIPADAQSLAPSWHARDGALMAQSSPSSNESLMVIHGADGEGLFAGRYLKLQMSGPQAEPLEITEVEVYEPMVPSGVTMVAKGRRLQALAMAVLEVPPGASWMTFEVKHPVPDDPISLGRHWRIAGFHEDWIAGTNSGVVDSRCPPPGEYEFQAQLRHSDEQWCEAMLRVPLIVPVPFWEKRGVLASAIALAAVLAAGLAWFVSRRIMARRVEELERKSALSNERARIARDMHDAVGSQLTQLAVLHEIVAEELSLGEEARSRLQHLTDSARASVAALDAVVWAVNPGNDNLAHMAGYLTQVAREYLVPLGIACRQDVPHEWPERIVSSRTRHEFHLAFREALQNVVKHAHAGEVLLTMRCADGCFTTSIADNGAGMPADPGGREKDGIENMRARLAALGGHCSVQNRATGGTVVELRIPL